MKFSKKFVNKLVTFTDKNFTYDSRKMKREGDNTPFDFVGYDYNDNILTTVYIRNTNCGLWVDIRQNGQTKFHGFCQNFNDVRNFKQAIINLALRA